MPKKTVKIPAYRHHKGSGQALVQINGARRYLGKYDSEKSQERYRRLVAELLATPIAVPEAGEAIDLAPLRRRTPDPPDHLRLLDVRQGLLH